MDTTLENQDTLCSTIANMKPTHGVNIQGNQLEHIFNDSDLKKKMLIGIASLVNKHKEIASHFKNIDLEELGPMNSITTHTEELDSMISNVTTHTECVVRRICLQDGQIETNELFIYMMLCQKHWVSIFTDQCCQLLLNNKQDLLQLVSSHSVISYVWPAVLSMIWEHHNTHPHIRSLSQEVIRRCSPLNPTLFSRIEEALYRVFKFEDWIHKMKNYERKSLQCCDLLKMLSEHNVLYIVNEYLNFTVDNFSEIRKFLVENTDSKCWQVGLFDVYCTVYHVALLLTNISHNQTDNQTFDSSLQQILQKVNDVPHHVRLQIGRSILSLFFLTQNDLKQNDQRKIMSNSEIIGSKSNETNDRVIKLKSKQNSNDSLFDKNNRFILNNLDNLKTLTSTLSFYLTHGVLIPPGTEIGQKTQKLQNELNDINWRLSIIQRLSSKPPPKLTLGDHLYGRNKSDLERCNHEKVPQRHPNTSIGQTSIMGCPLNSKSHSDVSVKEGCPLNLILSSPEDFATYCVIKEDLDVALSVVERYNLQDTNTGRQIISMNHYQSLYRTLSNASPNDTCQVALQQVDKYIAQCNIPRSSKLTLLTDILCCVPMSCKQSEQLVQVIEKQYDSCNPDDLPNFSTLLSHLKSKQIELSRCISDDLVVPSTTLVEFLASGCSHMNLLFWKSLERLSKEFTDTSETKRLEEYFVMLVSVIKQSPYLDGIEEGLKPFSSRVQKMFFYLSSIDSLMSDCRGNLLNYVDQNLTSRIGQAVFVRNEPITSLDLPFVNLAYHLVNFVTGSIPLSIEPPCMKQVIVLNEYKHVTEPIPSWPRATHKTVTSLLAQLTDTFSPHDVITRDIAAKIAHSDWTKEVLEDTRLLQNIETSRYTSGEDSTVFLVNLYNLMWVHALLALETSDTPLGLLSQSATCRHLTKRLVGYNLADLGVVTLYHIESVLLANYAHVNSPFVDPVLLNEQLESTRKDNGDLSVPIDRHPKLDSERKVNPSLSIDSDLSLQLDNPLVSWNVYRDPRIVFLLGNCYQLSPIIYEVSAFNWDTCLEQRMSQYAQAHIHLSHNVLHVPLLIFNYLEYVSSIQRPECEHNSSSDTSSNQSRETRAMLIEFVKEYTRVRSFILARKDVHVLDQVGFSINLKHPIRSNKSQSKTEDNVKIDTSIVQYVADYDLILAGIVNNLSKTTPVVTSPSKHSKDKKGALRSPPVVEHHLHNAYSRINDNLSNLCSRSHRVRLLSKINPGISPLICFLNWNLVDQEALWSCIEDEMSRGNFVLVLEMLYYVLTPRVFLEDVRWRQLYDSVLLELASNNDSVYILDVTSVPTMADFVLNNSRSSSLKCLQYLTARSHELDQDRADKVDRQFFLSKINQEITETCGLTEWSVGDETDPYEILREIINNQDVDLAQRWCQYRNLPKEYKPNLEVLQQYAIFLLSTHNETLAETMCHALSSSDLRELCTRLINSDCDVTHVKVIVNQALSRCEAERGDDYELYIRTVIGVDMLCLMNNVDQKLYRHLISHPYLIIEQLLLLTRLSLVETILDHIKPYVTSADTGTDKVLPGRLLQSEIDALLRTYATKALDFRICDARTSSSVLSNCRPVDKCNFSPPRTPPSKDEWIPNDECTQCMVCQVTNFSMFNRRHHCRRCGRLVCGACSENRMKVSGYGGVSVRVCTQCHLYATPRTLTLEITTTSTLDQQHPVFRVNTEDPNKSHPMEDSAYNATLRDEFSFDYAPSISLCLSILKFHTNNTTLAMYLCETCNGLLHVMKPSNREIDYSFVIRMIKCLMLACKVIYDVHGVESVTLDEICSQVNLLSILVNNNCCHLIPDKPLVGMNALRQLRDSLLKEERWNLALEVSTKAGLDYNSVWTVWGKACLKAGAWPEARNIFAKCHFDRRGESSTLIDILQILQTDTTSGDLATRLSRLKQPPLPSSTESSSWYSECLYYLHNYGSVSLILTFFVHRDRLKEALDYVLDKRVSVDNFVEHVYFRSLKIGNTDSLFTLMETRDPSLLSWKPYLRAVCAYCERNSLLNSLYEIQLRTHDHVRAAITCVLFYLKHVHTYFQLNEKSYHLTNARAHLNDYRAQKTNNQLGMSMSSSELSKQLILIQYQLKLITTIVSTNMNMANKYHGKLSTLFGGVEEKATMLLDVMTLEEKEKETTQEEEETKYRDLVRETVSALGLNPVPIYSELVKLLASQSRVQDIKNLILCLKPDLGTSCDDILMGAIRLKPPLVEQLISLLSKIPLQISLFIETGKLKSAYLLAVKHNRLADIRLVAQQAKHLDQSTILNICLKKIEFEESKMRREGLTSGEQKMPTSKMRDSQLDIDRKLKITTKSSANPSAARTSVSRSVRSGINISASPGRNTVLKSDIAIDEDNQPTRTDSKISSNSSTTSQSGQDRTKRGTSQSMNQSTSSPSSDTSFSEIAAVLRAYEKQRTPSSQSISLTGKSSSDSRVKRTPSDRTRSTESTPNTTQSPYSDIASVLRAYEQKRLKQSSPSSQESLTGSSSKSSLRRIQNSSESDRKNLEASHSKSKILTSSPGDTRRPKSKSSSDNNQS